MQARLIFSSPSTGAEAGPGGASINGVALHGPHETLTPEELRERAWGELLRQRAVAAGLLPARLVAVAPELEAQEHAAIDALLARELQTPEPDEAACRRHYEANRRRFVEGQALHVRHILFAVTPRVDVHALTRRAEQALLELLRPDAPPGRFEQLAAELSNCPSGAQGGDLGWIGPADCAPELANELFYQQDSSLALGVHPRLVRTRFGLHIVRVMGRRPGKRIPFEEARPRIERDLSLRARAVALRHYLHRLAADARVCGVDLGASDGPLLQ